MIIAIIFVIGLLGYIAYYCWRIDSYKWYKPTEEDLARERLIMAAERKHFGRWQLQNERQTKEYKDWLKTI